MTRLRLLIALLLLSCPAAGAFAQSVTRDPGKVRAGTYAVEPSHTAILFGISHLGFSTYYGRFSTSRGTLHLVPEKPAESRLEVHIPISALNTPSDQLNSQLLGPAWFDAAKYPEMSFVSTGIAPYGDGDAKVTGSLTLHGVTRPVTLDVHFNGAGLNPLDHAYTVGFQATGTLKRSDFGITKFVPLIGDEVYLILSGTFERQGG